MEIYEALNTHIASQFYLLRSRPLDCGSSRAVARSNHDNTNMMRQVRHVENFIELLKTSGSEYAKFVKDPAFVEHLKLAMYFRSFSLQNVFILVLQEERLK